MGEKRHNGQAPLDRTLLRWGCDPARFSFEDTSEVAPLEEIIGQPQAIAALELGLALDSPGYNLFVCGLSGTGRMTTLQSHLERTRPPAALPPDRVYAYRFSDPSCPQLLTLPRGRGRELSRALEHLVVDLVRELHELVHGDEAEERLQSVLAEFVSRKKVEKDRFVERLAEEGMVLFEVSSGDGTRAVLAARVEGFPEPLTLEQIEIAAAEGRVPTGERVRLRELFLSWENNLLQMLQRWARGERAYSADMAKERAEICTPIVDELVDGIRGAFVGTEAEPWLKRIRDEVIEGLALFLDAGSERETLPASMTPEMREIFFPFLINVILDNSDGRGAPVVIESQPTFTRLFGGIDRRDPGRLDPDADFLRLRGGSLLAAEGGTLVVSAIDIIEQGATWARLKAVLRDRVIAFPETDGEGRPTTTVRPDPIPLRTKVVLVGSNALYQNLLISDPEFEMIFKVRVDFAADIPATDALIEHEIPALISKIVTREKLLPVDRTGVAAVIEAMVRLGPRRGRMSAVFTLLADCLREATLCARAEKVKRISREHVECAIANRRERSALARDRAEREILEGTVRIASEGSSVGEVSALVMRVLGEDRFGYPVRISAAVGMGQDGVVSIERDVGLSGESHDKGVRILTGLLRSRYTREFPLALSASIALEQTYLPVDGDSATLAETLVLLSAIAEVPLRQDLAVTGSLDQRGRTQAVGGVNEKIEGIFRIVKARGFPAECGTVIPASSIEQLMLLPEVVAACERGDFRVHAVESLDEAIELFTGLPAGVRGRDGKYPAHSFHAQVESRLREFAKGFAKFRGN